MSEKSISRYQRERHPHLHKLLPLILSKEAVKILDLGCGLMQNSKFLSENGFNVVSLDFNYETCLTGRNTFSKAVTVCGDIRFLPFRAQTFNVVIAVDVIEHIPVSHVLKSLVEMIQILRNDSLIFLHVPLERSFAYRFLRSIGKIWTRDPTHKSNFKYSEIKKLIHNLSVTIEKEWIDLRMKRLKNNDLFAVAVTFVLRVQ